MSNIWLTSDFHFGHDREFVWKARGYSSVEEMNEIQIEKFNSLVQSDDTVYILGDLMLGNNDEGIKCLKRLNGNKYFIRGNHDTDVRVNLYMDEQNANIGFLGDATTLKYRKYYFYMSHYPTMTGNLQRESLHQMTLNLYGHTHQTTNFYQDMPFMYHVGVDSHDGYPVLLDDIIQQMKDKVEECKSFL